jgi:hypothetical protein
VSLCGVLCWSESGQTWPEPVHHKAGCLLLPPGLIVRVGGGSQLQATHNAHQLRQPAAEQACAVVLPKAAKPGAVCSCEWGRCGCSYPVHMMQSSQHAAALVVSGLCCRVGVLCQSGVQHIVQCWHLDSCAVHKQLCSAQGPQLIAGHPLLRKLACIIWSGLSHQRWRYTCHCVTRHCVTRHHHPSVFWDRSCGIDSQARQASLS